jgi:starvation-inducible outer membrane lipoprotein
VGTRSDGRREEARAQLWVRRDGTVLQQEARLGGSVVRFVRQPRQAVANVAASAEGAPPR